MASWLSGSLPLVVYLVRPTIIIFFLLYYFWQIKFVVVVVTTLHKATTWTQALCVTVCEDLLIYLFVDLFDIFCDISVQSKFNTQQMQLYCLHTIFCCSFEENFKKSIKQNWTIQYFHLLVQQQLHVNTNKRQG